MYVLRFGAPFAISNSIDFTLLDRYHQLHPEKPEIEGDESIACFFADQDFIEFIKSEIDNGYQLKHDSAFEIIEYDETKGHPILVELTGEYDVDLFDFENGILWSKEPGTPEYRRLCKSYYYLYDRDTIESLQENKTDFGELNSRIKEVVSMFDNHTVEEINRYVGQMYRIDSPEGFADLLRLTQTEFGEVNLDSIIKNSQYIEGKRRLKIKEEKAREMAQIQSKVESHCVSLDSETEYISFGQTVEEFESRPIKPIKNNSWVKPTGGLWAAQYSPEPFSHSEWEDYCRMEDYLTDSDYFDKGVKFTLKKDAKLFQIDTLEDFEFLLEKFQTRVDGRTTIDFERLSTMVDGINVTSKGQWLMDFYRNIDSKYRISVSPFCVSGITLFGKDVIENVREFNPDIENQLQAKEPSVTQIAQEPIMVFTQTNPLEVSQTEIKTIDSSQVGEFLGESLRTSQIVAVDNALGNLEKTNEEEQKI